ncbi:MAG: hypothetical protein HYY02_11320 [Chloroflexi bacterium]|nr:hypothetical protein [Chloroflexota bacterium]
MTQPIPDQGLLTCATHRDVPTLLRCGKCDKPICPRCLVHTPVGPRCRDCARLRPLPTFQVGPLLYLRAAGTGLALAVAAGLVWSMVPFGGVFSFFLSPLAGYAIGEGVSRAANRRQSTVLKVMAGSSLLVAYLVKQGGVGLLVAATLLLAGTPVPLISVLATAVLGTLLNPLAWIVVAIGAYVAVSRIG